VDPDAMHSWNEVYDHMAWKYNLQPFAIERGCSHRRRDRDRRASPRPRSPLGPPSNRHRDDRAADDHPWDDVNDPDHAASYQNRSSGHRDHDREPQPDYATFDPDPKVWWEILEDLEVDHPACRELFCLAQYNEDGRKRANSLIGKILKGESDHKHYHSGISAWLHSAILVARNAMEPDWGHVDHRAGDRAKGRAKGREGGAGNGGKRKRTRDR